MSNEAIQRLIFQSALTLDAEKYKAFLALCTEDFQYTAVTHSPDLGMDMTWLAHGRKGLQDMFGMIPQHVRLKGKFKRHVSVYTIDHDEPAKTAAVSTSLMLIHTNLEGVSKLFAAAQYEDLVDTSGATPLLKKRLVRLDTRDLSPGIHVPV
jgi:methanesulfonate monooxygenase small subunit